MQERGKADNEYLPARMAGYLDRYRTGSLCGRTSPPSRRTPEPNFYRKYATRCYSAGFFGPPGNIPVDTADELLSLGNILAKIATRGRAAARSIGLIAFDDAVNVIAIVAVNVSDTTIPVNRIVLCAVRFLNSISRFCEL